MRLLLLGENHLLRQSLLEQAEEQEIRFEISAVSDEALSEDVLNTLINTVQPDCIINLAYYFDWFQSRSFDLAQLSRQVETVSTLARLCQKNDIILLQPSSYRVFGGEKVTAYTEADVPVPMSALGEALWQAEQLVARHCTKHVLIRLGCLLDYSKHGKLGTLLQSAETSSEVFLADDRRGNPTPIDDAARVIIGILQQLDCDIAVWGTYHYGAMEATTPLVWGQIALDEARLYQANLTDRVIAKTHTDLQDVLAEPQSAILSCKKILHTFGIKQRAWRTAIPILFKRFYNQSMLTHDERSE